MNIGQIKCKSILNKSGIKGMDYAVNPYTGCGHGCAYCYARFMKRFGHAKEEWGTFIDIKTNAVEKLKEETSKKPKGRVLLSSVTDPYQPIEEKYKLTRGILEILLDTGFSVDILTKSNLVLRDLDLITKFDNISVGLTITSFDDKVRKAFESGASSVEARLEALKKISNEGIDTYAFLGPLLPYLSDQNLEQLFNVLTGRVNRIIVDRLNIKCGNLPSIRRVIDQNYPDLKP
ncbi:radical SAM protein, partial [Candidatus Bathyarchaeota archaeon]|nr:radical SAM protein [Candidatus Bathyarchaeota archaeon]